MFKERKEKKEKKLSIKIEINTHTQFFLLQVSFNVEKVINDATIINEEEEKKAPRGTRRKKKMNKNEK